MYKNVKFILKDLLSLQKRKYCSACGKTVSKWIFNKIIDDDLAQQWNLSDELRKKFDLRESQYCPYCGNSTRTRSLSQAIINNFPHERVCSLKDWVSKMREKNDFKIAEINSCGNLHTILSKLPNIAYSEYPQEDITNLSYPENSFNVVLHSDVLEHVSNVCKALKECRRILKKGGICLFTVPLIPDRKTKQCAFLDKKTGRITYRKRPSYHGGREATDYLVWWEFGYDIMDEYKLSIAVSNPETLTYILTFQKN